ncbi:membrane protein [Shouchella clausii]|uniref:YjiH family protein n=1 Tax=Shouchella tritolerans TaxID=2979466 RepID=UPI001B0CACFE|nr:YjiH family protein [Shouchella tritolerans]GIN12936.1 membrane protein [Shouchella clausii]
MGTKVNVKNTLLFVLPSLIGILLFMTPFTVVEEGETSVKLPVALAADWLMALLTVDTIILITVIAMVISGLLSIVFSVLKKRGNGINPLWDGVFATTPGWLVVRAIGAILGVMVYFQIGPQFLISGDTGQVLLNDLLPFLFTIFLFAGMLLPLLLNFGLMEFVGSLLKNFMRPLFRLPGRASIDCIASWIGDGTVGVMLSNQQYESGKYTQREAAIVASAFSVVSITFSIYILSQLGISHLFWQFFFTLFVAGFFAAIIMPRIPPLSWKQDTYIDGSPGKQEPKVKGVWKHGFNEAISRAATSAKSGGNMKNGFKNVLDLWFGVLPVVMTIGTLAAAVATYTPLFEWLAVPFIPVLEWMNVPQAAEASKTILVGFADMLLPTVLAEPFGITNEFTLFVIGTLSVSQLIYMSETGGVLIASKIPVSFFDCVLLFLIRTIITLPIIVLMAHLLL